MGAKAHSLSSHPQKLYGSAKTRISNFKKVCPHCHGKGTLTYHNYIEAYCGYCEGNIFQ